MITITNLLFKKSIQNKYTFLKDKIPTDLFKKLHSSIFFDIETTGLSARNSMCYLIGVVYLLDEEWHYTQWFADEPGCEKELLENFFSFISNYQYLIHFNGDGFDVPFLEQRCKYMDIKHPLIMKEQNAEAELIELSDMTNSQINPIISIDLYKHIRKLSKLLDFENCKQKSIEQFLGIDREDQYTGGELIKVYQEYVTDYSKEKEALLLLHNHDDIVGLIDILPVLSYESFLSGSICSKNVEQNKDETNDYLCNNNNTSANSKITYELNEATTFEGYQIKELLITASFLPILPVRLTIKNELFYLIAENNSLKLQIPIHETTLKYFYPNYKDYYYLPEEDTAIYKSVATYVDKSHRKQAKADNCYVKKEGLFLPQFEEIYSPCFKSNLKDKITFFEVNDQDLNNQSKIITYVNSLLRKLN